MRIFLALALLLPPVAAAAQALPDAPAAAPVSLEQAIGRVGAVTLPSFAEWQKRKQREFFAARADEEGAGGSPDHFFNFNRDSGDPAKRFMTTPRFTTEALDVNLSRPSPRLTFGVGYAEHDMIVQNRTMTHDVQKYAFVKLELGRTAQTRKRILWLPTATYTETETSPKMRVDSDEYNRGLRELKP